MTHYTAYVTDESDFIYIYLCICEHTLWRRILFDSRRMTGLHFAMAGRFCRPPRQCVRIIIVYVTVTSRTDAVAVTTHVPPSLGR